MFDLGWDEMAVIAVVALVFLGPKELPNALRTVSSLTKAARKLAGEFQSGVNEIIREADLEDTKKKLTELQSINKNTIQKAVEKAVDPTGEIKTAMKADETPPVTTVTPKVDPVAVEAKPVEPVAIESPVVESPVVASAPAEVVAEETAADKFEIVEPAPQKDPAA